MLIVEDDAQVRVLMMRWLMSEGHLVSAAGTAAEALEEMTRNPVALVIADIGLPGRDGLWLAGEIRRRYPETVLIMATGSCDFHKVVGSLRHGAMDYLRKPFQRGELLDAVRGGLAHYANATAQRQRVVALETELEAKKAAIAEGSTDARIAAGTAIEGMLAMLEAHAPGARAHAQRVARLTADTALLMGITDPLLSQIEKAALLHDLGRVALPVDTGDGRTAGAGTTGDRPTLLPEIGATLMRHVSFLERPAEIVLGILEHYDGTGAPRGLQGRQIPLGARIIAVADRYDQLTERGHGGTVPALSASSALAALEQEGGTRLDPEVLAAFRTAATLSEVTAAL
jgi:response regulator RpfG family c-di-GMP phosphodiesterase